MEFLEAYRLCFKNTIGTPIEFKPVCIVTEYNQKKNKFNLFSTPGVEKCYPSKNPPFNTKPLIPNRSYKEQSDFIDLIHNS